MNRTGFAPLVQDDDKVEYVPEQMIIVRVNEKITGFKWMRI